MYTESWDNVTFPTFEVILFPIVPLYTGTETTEAPIFFVYFGVPSAFLSYSGEFTNPNDLSPIVNVEALFSIVCFSPVVYTPTASL